MNAPDETTSDARLTRKTWHLFVSAVRNFVTSEVGGKAAMMLGLLLVLLLGINGLNVVNSYVGRDFMSAIERRDQPEFVRQTVRYLVVFGVLTTATVLSRFLEERIGLLWRRWLTGNVVHAYLSNRAYLRLTSDASLGNPDQRIAEDCRTFVTMTLSLLLMALNGTLTVIAFAGVLWSISRTLFLVGLGYAAIGSLLTVLLGRRLVDLNYRQADREADFRATLIHVRENAEPIALLHREREIESRLLSRLAALVGNMKRIIGVNRNVGFFTTGYNYLIQLIPILIVAPLFMRRETEFGVITQSTMAFSHLLGAFSLIVTQFPTISSYASVLARLDALATRIQAPPPDDPSLVIIEAHGRLAYEKLTLRAPHEARVLVRELDLEVTPGSRLVIRCQDPAARRALMWATAGMWSDGAGRIVRPALAHVAFLPERPYLPPGTLRTTLRGDNEAPPSDAEIGAALARLGAEDIVTNAAGLDVEHTWDKVLSTRDQALLSVARLMLGRPRFAFVDNLGRTLGDEEVPAVLQALAEFEITVVVLEGVNGEVAGEAAVVIADDGSWQVV